MQAFEAVIIMAVQSNQRTARMFEVITKFYSAVPNPVRGAVAAIPTLTQPLLDEDVSTSDVEQLIATYSQYPDELYWVWENGTMLSVTLEEFAAYLHRWKAMLLN